MPHTHIQYAGPEDRIAAYKAYHELPPEIQCEEDGRVVNIEGQIWSGFNWVVDYDLEIDDQAKPEWKDYELFIYGNRRWLIMPT
jgi:hypothetical protein